MNYKDAGVDIEAGRSFVDEIKHIVTSTQFGMKYQEDNPLFEDVWRAIDIQSGERISRFVKE